MLALRLVTWNYSSIQISTFSAKSGRSSSSPWSSRRRALSAWASRVGPRYGIDFRGGALITVSFANRPPVDKVRAALSGKLPVEVQEVSGRPEDIIGIDALQDAALQASRQKVIDAPGCRVRTAGQRQVQYQLRWRSCAGRSSARCLSGCQRADVGPATADAGVEHHGLPEGALRI